MIRGPIIAAVTLVAVVAACGGGGDREAFVGDDRMLRYKKDGLNAWREFTRYAERNDFNGGEPVRTRSMQSLVRAAQVGSQLHLQDCDRALS
jgi:hypothetical protein